MEREEYEFESPPICLPQRTTHAPPPMCRKWLEFPFQSIGQGTERRLVVRRVTDVSSEPSSTFSTTKWWTRFQPTILFVNIFYHSNPGSAAE